MGSDAAHTAALQHGPWRMTRDLSSGLEQVERFLVRSRFDLAPWGLVALIAGIASWFITPSTWHWRAVIGAGLGIALAAIGFFRAEGRYPYLRRSLAVVGIAVALGCALVWIKAEFVGARPIARPIAATLEATVLDREDQPAEQRVRLTLATREPGGARAIKVRLNLPLDQAKGSIEKGARLCLRARLVPPPAPMLPGGYDFSRTAWFAGIAATGSVLGPVEVLQTGERGPVAAAQRQLSEHVRANLDGSAGTIAAALASGDRGAIAEADDQAMRDAGLTHLLSVSGLHVSAVVAAGYFVALRMLALWPWLALRVRLPLVAAGTGALANVVAIPLTTLASMPLIALALLFDLVGIGAPFWWLAGKTLELLLALAHWVAGMPGAVKAMPGMGRGAFALFVLGGLWLALWQSRIRLLGLVPVAAGLVMLTQVRTPDLLVSSDGKHVGITGAAGEDLLVLRDSKSGYTRDNLLESAGMSGATRTIAEWPGANCNADFCALTLEREGRSWRLLIGRGTDFVPERALAAACDRADIVIAGRYLPRSCQPRWLKVDRRMLDQTGGLKIDLAQRELTTVAQNQGQHGWWKPRQTNQPSAKALPTEVASSAPNQ